MTDMATKDSFVIKCFYFINTPPALHFEGDGVSHDKLADPPNPAC